MVRLLIIAKRKKSYIMVSQKIDKHHSEKL